MDTQNHYYGHSAILSLACGSARVRHIGGLVQHGWSFNDPLLSMFHDFNINATTLFTWTSSARNWQTKSPNVHAIGAPWMYLTKGERRNLNSTSSIPLFVPRHGTRITGVGVDHQSLANEYASHYGAGRVLLHSDDAYDQSVHAAWEAAGHQVTFSKSRFDPDFLISTWDELSRAQVVVSDGLSTSLFYAASLGVEIEVSNHNAALPWLAKYDANLKVVFPEFYESCTKEERREIAMSELGLADVRSAETLKQLLSLDSSLSLPASAVYWCYSPIRKVVKVLRSEAADESALVDSHWTNWLKRPLENLPRKLPSLKRTSIKKAFSD